MVDEKSIPYMDRLSLRTNAVGIYALGTGLSWHLAGFDAASARAQMIVGVCALAFGLCLDVRKVIRWKTR